MNYDPEARRTTPLAGVLADRIRAAGPMTVADYMRACLDDRTHGYYRTRVAIGAAGDFVTAPEISQVFGELLGLWSAVVWQSMGAPEAIRLVEVGPGRGTMMADALRAARAVPGFLAAADVVLVEPSPVLAAIQRATLAGAPRPPRWHDALSDVEQGPAIVLANEVLDVLPVRQLVRTDAGWRERTVETDAAGRLVFGLTEVAPDGASLPPLREDAPPGAVVEIRDVETFAGSLARIAGPAPFAALLIDYGHIATGFGDTLQAVRAQRHEHPLTSPGEADLTTQVDFEAAASAFRDAGLLVDGPVNQAELLGALGGVERASRLMAANPARAPAIEAGIARLMSPQGMGTRFKSLGLRRSGVSPLPAFPAA